MVLSEWLLCWVLQSYRAGSASVPTLAPLAHNYEHPKFCLSLVLVSLCHSTISSMLVLSVIALKAVDNRRELYQWTTTPHHRLRTPPLHHQNVITAPPAPVPTQHTCRFKVDWCSIRFIGALAKGYDDHCPVIRLLQFNIQIVCILKTLHWI
jgi:hypothetical protein